MIKISTLLLATLLASIAAGTEKVPVRSDPRVQNALNLLEIWIDSERAYDNIPAISAAAVYDQEVLWAGGFGEANLEEGIEATSNTIYSICSISKLFTSVAIMQLRDQGKLRLKDQVAHHLPWFAIQNTFQGAAPVTIEGILTHSAGLPRESDFPYWTVPFNFPGQADIKRKLPEQTMLYRSQQIFQYSNLGLAIAGEIVTTVSDITYGEYVRKYILDPLGMMDTTHEIPTALRGKRLAIGYSATRRAGGRMAVPPFEAQGIAAAAGFASTVLDLSKFASWQFRLLDDNYTGSGEILTANTLREMHRVHWIDPDWERTRGLGFSIDRSRKDNTTFVGHGGSCPGYRSHIRIQTKDKIASIVMANANGVDPAHFTKQIHEILSRAIKNTRDNPGNGKQTTEDLMKYVGTYDDFPWSGETHVVPWQGSIAMLSLPTNDPVKSLVRLKHMHGDVFRRIRDDEALGEEVFFEIGPNGRVLRLWQHSNPSERIHQ